MEALGPHYSKIGGTDSNFWWWFFAIGVALDWIAVLTRLALYGWFDKAAIALPGCLLATWLLWLMKPRPQAP